MRLILVRHGRTASNVRLLLDTAPPGPELDAVGREQADALVERLAPWPIQAVYASTLTRSQQTAAPLAAALGLDVTVLPGLREVSAGEDEMAENVDRYLAVMMAWAEGHLDVAVPGGDDGVAFFDRFDDAVAQIVAAGHDVAALVSHGAALRMWCGTRVDGVDVRLGKRGWIANVGYVVADGDPASGWRLVAIEGVERD